MIAVIGAGPAGLALAWRLTRAGHDVTVLESAPSVGGMAGSRTISGQRVDLGSHRLHPSMPPEIRTAIEELVELQERPRRGRIRLDGRWVPFPPTPLGLARGLGAGGVARTATSAAWAAVRPRRAASYADVVRKAQGDHLWESFHEPYAWKLWDTDPHELAPELAHRRMARTAGDVARDAVRSVVSSPTFLYPRRGFGALSEAMAELVPDLRLGTKVTGLIEHDDRVIVGLGDGRIVTADLVFSTVSAARTATWLGLVEPHRVVLPTRGLVLVYLTVDGRPYTDHDAHYLPDRAVLPTRISEPANYRSSAADPPDRTVLCAEVPCWPEDAVWRASPDALARRIVDDLARCGLPDPTVRAVDVVRLPAVYPVLTPASLSALDRAEDALRRSGRVTVLGRQGLFTPDNTHHVLQMAFAAADCVGKDGTFDRVRWRDERARFRDFVVDS